MPLIGLETLFLPNAQVHGYYRNRNAISPKIAYRADDFHNPEFTAFGNVNRDTDGENTILSHFYASDIQQRSDNDICKRRGRFDVRMEPPGVEAELYRMEDHCREIYRKPSETGSEWASTKAPRYTALLSQLSASSSQSPTLRKSFF
ncbi:hypothetical protein PENNAL_c0030G12111 [Penicillium nalgiovense]|uniref:Uncharacterized protein n=1 Tax=Penicillium nalgiovense TaxID=60175 RepID=A0A1V6Y8Z8_PENNA|nr:hypothetical protein PENNAL_c0030G12111 [Penicillium nalgiovense]